ncbi:MAG: acyltransferase domain-containing protein [Bacteroidota bacterium]
MDMTLLMSQQKNWGAVASSSEQFFPVVFQLSAGNDRELKNLASHYEDLLRSTDKYLVDIAYSLHKQSALGNHIVLIIAESKEQVVAGLRAYQKGEDFEGLVSGFVEGKESPKVAFICSGQGPLWHAMGRELVETSGVFRQVLKEIDKIFHRLSGNSLLEEMNQTPETTRIGDFRVAQPVTTAIQIGLVHMWKELGVVADGFVGHSVGEVAAAYGAGAFTLEQAVEVIYTRSKVQDRAAGAGVMMAVGLSLFDAMKEIWGVEDRVSVAAINGPEMLTLSGDREPLEAIAQRLEKKDVFNKILSVTVPSHSHHMVPLKEELLNNLASLKPTEARVPLYSSVTGNQENGLHLNKDYWYNNVRYTVYFTAAIERMIEDGYNTFVEIAPHPMLATSVKEMLGAMKKDGHVIASIGRDINKMEQGGSFEGSSFLQGAAQLSLAGVRVNWDEAFNKFGAREVMLPPVGQAWQEELVNVDEKESEDVNLASDLLDQPQKGAILESSELENELQILIAGILEVEVDTIGLDKSLSKMGMNSPMLYALQEWIEAKIDFPFPMGKIAKGPSITELAQEIVESVYTNR